MDYPINISKNEIKLTAKNINTEYSHPWSLLLLTWNGKHTPASIKGKNNM